LSDAEKTQRASIVKKGTHKSREITRARVLLSLDSGKDRATIQVELGIDVSHYYRIKKRYFEGGLSAALEELPRSGQPPNYNRTFRGTDYKFSL
jgi:putative transposase